MQRQIGKTELKVRAIGLGAMPLSLAGRPSEEDAIRVLHAAWDAGTDFVDTADAYCETNDDFNHNERLIRKALDAYAESDRIVVATKGGCLRPEGAWTVCGSPQYLRNACEASLQALGVDCIDLYQWHAPDPDVPFGDSIVELAALQQQGKIKHLGLSNVTPEQVQDALAIVRIESVQNRFHPFEQVNRANGMLDLCAKEQLTFLPHSPVGGHFGHRSAAGQATLSGIADAHGASTYQVMLAWHLQLGEHVLPIPGASRIESAVSSSEAVKFTLTDEQMAAIDALDGVELAD